MRSAVESRTNSPGTGRKDDPLYRARRLLTRADERLNDTGRTKLLGLLEAGDPHSEVRTAWHAKETVRQFYAHTDPDLALTFVERLGQDLQDDDCRPEINILGRTLLRWKHRPPPGTPPMSATVQPKQSTTSSSA